MGPQQCQNQYEISARLPRDGEETSLRKAKGAGGKKGHRPNPEAIESRLGHLSVICQWVTIRPKGPGADVQLTCRSLLPRRLLEKAAGEVQIGPHVSWGLPFLSELPLLWQSQNVSSYSSCITYERLCLESRGFFPCPHAILPEPGTSTGTTRGWGVSG